MAAMSFEMSSDPITPEEISSKVLRRAEIAKMSRTLQDRLAYASYKNKMGMTKLSFDIVEAQVAASRSSPKKKRRTATGSVVSSASSSSSSSTTTNEDMTFSLFPQSSPASAPFFSDDTYPLTEPRRRSTLRYSNFDDTPTVRARRVKRKNIGSNLGDAIDITKPETWKPSESNNPTTTFCDSSPLQQRLHPDFRTAAGPNISFAADLATSPNFGPSSPSPPSEPELPVHSFQRSGSPPRTPPPTRRKTHTNTHTSEGAQLLMHLASSPTPAAKNPSTAFIPSTPPRNLGATPNGLLDAVSPGLFNFGTPVNFNTPGPGAFNLAEFCNVTPSPAQAAFGSRTPLFKTPVGGSSSTRRALDFDSLMPPIPSPAKDKGLNLDLDGGVLDD